jgi:hypothetical protein
MNTPMRRNNRLELVLGLGLVLAQLAAWPGGELPVGNRDPRAPALEVPGDAAARGIGAPWFYDSRLGDRALAGENSDFQST